MDQDEADDYSGKIRLEWRDYEELGEQLGMEPRQVENMMRDRAMLASFVVPQLKTILRWFRTKCSLVRETRLSGKKNHLLNRVARLYHMPGDDGEGGGDSSGGGSHGDGESRNSLYYPPQHQQQVRAFGGLMQYHNPGMGGDYSPWQQQQPQQQQQQQPHQHQPQQPNQPQMYGGLFEHMNLFQTPYMAAVTQNRDRYADALQQQQQHQPHGQRQNGNGSARAQPYANSSSSSSLSSSASASASASGAVSEASVTPISFQFAEFDKTMPWPKDDEMRVSPHASRFRHVVGHIGNLSLDSLRGIPYVRERSFGFMSEDANPALRDFTWCTPFREKRDPFRVLQGVLSFSFNNPWLAVQVFDFHMPKEYHAQLAVHDPVPIDDDDSDGDDDDDSAKHAFPKTAEVWAKPPKYEVHVRRFNVETAQHVDWSTGHMLMINNHSVHPPKPSEPELKKKKKRKRGFLVRSTADISAQCVVGYNSVRVANSMGGGSHIDKNFVFVVELVRKLEMDQVVDLIVRNSADILKIKDDKGGKGGDDEHKSSTVKPEVVHRCAICGFTDNLLRCSRCKTTWYCNEQHQRIDWPAHRETCKPPEPGQDPDKKRVVNKTGSTIVVDDDDDDIQVQDEDVSLSCPLSIDRIGIPARGKNCVHRQCFDLRTYLMYCGELRHWQCPTCLSPVPAHHIIIDYKLLEFLKTAPAKVQQVRALPDGEYRVRGAHKPAETNGVKTEEATATAAAAATTTTATTTTTTTTSATTTTAAGDLAEQKTDVEESNDDTEQINDNTEKKNNEKTYDGDEDSDDLIPSSPSDNNGDHASDSDYVLGEDVEVDWSRRSRRTKGRRGKRKTPANVLEDSEDDDDVQTFSSGNAPKRPRLHRTGSADEPIVID